MTPFGARLPFSFPLSRATVPLNQQSGDRSYFQVSQAILTMSLGRESEREMLKGDVSSVAVLNRMRQSLAAMLCTGLTGSPWQLDKADFWTP